MHKFKFGEVVKDKITGERGCVMVRAYYYTGCIHYGFIPEGRDKDGKVKEWEWHDEVRLESVPGATEIKLDSRTETEIYYQVLQPKGSVM